ncbi:hypothetical protein BGX31_010198, partial [Mortierella sp. GBA43]
MDATQSFRLFGGTDIRVLFCDQHEGQNVIYWEDILEVFPGARYVKDGNNVIKKLKGSGKESHRIKHHPDIILDVVLSNSIAGDDAQSPTSPSSMSFSIGQTSDPTGAATDSLTNDNDMKELQGFTAVCGSLVHGNDIDDMSSALVNGSLRQSFDAKKDPKAVLSHNQVVRFSQTETSDSAFEQRLVTSFLPEVQVQMLASADVHKWNVQAIQHDQVGQLGEQLIAILQHLKHDMTENNALVSGVKDLVLMNNELVTGVKDLTLKNTKLSKDMFELQKAFGAKQEEMKQSQEEMKQLQEEMKQLQIQTLNQLVLLQNRVQALMTQTFELHEYPIPRLFVVLPQDASAWDNINIFSNRFRLYFLCECGEHTKPTNPKIPHHIHIAKHEGYEITRPTEFFEKYGQYALTILKMLKFGISVAGVAIPALSHLVRVDAVDKATDDLKKLSGDLLKGMDKTIGCLERVTAGHASSSDGIFDPTENNEALEGADLRKL